MASLKRILAAIAAVQLGVRVVSAQKNDSLCIDSRFENLNATASYTVPGFAPPGDSSSKDGTWTFSTGAVNYGGNTTQRLWVNTSPEVKVGSDSLPYQGCVLGFFNLATDASKGDQDKKGDCKSTLGEACVTALLKNTNAIARNLSADADKDAKRYRENNDSNFSFGWQQCLTFPARAIPEECRTGNNSDLFIAAADIGGHRPIYIDEKLALKEEGLGDSIPCPNLGTGTAATSPLIEIPAAPAPDTKGFDPNYSTYDQWLNRVLPVLVPVWSKDPKKPWSDSRLICVRPEAIKQQEGKKNTSPNAAQPSSSSSPSSSPSSRSSPSSSPSPTAAGQPSLGIKQVSYTRAIALGIVCITTLYFFFS